VLAFNLLGDAIRDALDPAVRDIAGGARPTVDASLDRAPTRAASRPLAALAPGRVTD
jgi:hypothetical protein